LAADKGAPRALSNLARIYYEGLGVLKNLAEAIRLFEAAATAGEFLPQIELGRIYSRGLGVARDDNLAKRWYLAAVAQEGGIGDCDELREAKAYIAKFSSSRNAPCR
ncbi:MAG: tetratricopeptide repeat protein, partial [Candidatus Angelobacter sp.]